MPMHFMSIRWLNVKSNKRGVMEPCDPPPQCYCTSLNQ